MTGVKKNTLVAAGAPLRLDQLCASLSTVL